MIHIEIHGVRALALFTAIIRGDNVDSLITQLTAQMRDASLDSDLDEVVENSADHHMSTIGAGR